MGKRRCVLYVSATIVTEYHRSASGLRDELAQRDWNYDTYAQATIEAIDVAREVSGSPDVNIMGACLGGMTAAIVQAHLAARDDNRINSVTLLVTLLGTGPEGG